MTIEGQIVNIDGVKSGRIEIDETSGLITKVTSSIGRADLLLKDELIFPGFIDIHVHAREDVSHSQDYKEDFLSASEAAINGGLTAFAEMPNNPAPPVDEQSYKLKHQLIQKSLCGVVLYAGVGPSTRPLPFLVPYKVFMGPSVGGLFFKSQNELEGAIKSYQGQSISFHCEDPKILEKNKNQLSHEMRRPQAAEILAVEFALGLIEKYHLHGKICHCSTKKSLELIVRAKKRGVDVTVEVTPHHLYYDETMLDEKNRNALQVNPPIRQTKENRLALIRALKDGDIDFLATDHAPHTREEKQEGVSGMPHLDTYGPFISWLMAEHSFNPQEIARVCSFNPGQFLNRFFNIKYGKIAEGFEGSLTIINSRRPITINQSNLRTKCGWSPFENISFPGSVMATILKGKVYKLKANVIMAD